MMDVNLKVLNILQNQIKKKYFSNTAFMEAKKVINNLRRVSLKIIACIKNYLTRNLINSKNVNNHFRKIKELF